MSLEPFRSLPCVYYDYLFTFNLTNRVKVFPIGGITGKETWIMSTTVLASNVQEPIFQIIAIVIIVSIWFAKSSHQ